MADFHPTTGEIRMATNEAMALRYIKHVLQQALEKGGFTLTGEIDFLRQELQIKLDQEWIIHGITEAEDRLSFHASADNGATPVHFIVKDEKSQEVFQNWVKDADYWLRSGWAVPGGRRLSGATFVVGVTHYVPGAKESAPRQLSLT